MRNTGVVFTEPKSDLELHHFTQLGAFTHAKRRDPAGAHVYADGLRVRSPGAAPIYVIIDGKLHWIPNPSTYNHLFNRWDDVLSVENVETKIPRGTDISVGAILAAQSGSENVFLISNHMKRLIAGDRVFAKYGFSAEHVHSMPDIYLNAFPTGPELQ